MSFNQRSEKHKALEDRVVKWFESNDFLIASATYHDVLKRDASTEKMIELLQKTYTSTSLYLRGRADRFVIHKTKPLVFEIECKTHLGSGEDMLMELTPIVHHIQKSKLGVLCLYIYEHVDKTERGFWVNEMPKPCWISISDRWGEKGTKYFQDLASEFFPEVDCSVNTPRSSRGSGTPFIKIKKSIIDLLPDWKTLVESQVQPKPTESSQQ